jgi:predicted metal-binding membrane protein
VDRADGTRHVRRHERPFGVDDDAIVERAHLALLFAMWTAMMIGMMLPSAAPTLLIYGMVARRGDGASDAPLRVHIFAGGYLVAWTVFSAVATLAQRTFTAPTCCRR